MQKKALHDKEYELLELGQKFQHGKKLWESNMAESPVDDFLKLRSILRKLPCKYAIILLNDFFEPKTEYWWLDYMSKYAYKYNRKKAINLFFRRYAEMLYE